MSTEDDFEAVRRDPDPIRRGKRATGLITTYQQRATDLARLRKAAVEEAQQTLGMSYTEIAAALGITKGRITQIRKDAADVQRAFFGVGPVSVGIPYRYQTTDRERPLIAAEDAETGEQLERLLASLAFTVDRYQISPETPAAADGDGVVVCGPKSAPLAADLLDHDPEAGLVHDGARWWFECTATGERFGSPADDDPSSNADLAYVARHRYDDRVIVHIAGIHAIGSLGATHFLTAQLGPLFREVGDVSFSAAIRAEYDGLTITNSEIAAGPYLW